MTNQEAFETMVRHAREQGGRSLNSQGKCRYRGQNGTKCFVGALIPDAEYTVMLEGRSPAAIDAAWLLAIPHDAALTFRAAVHGCLLMLSWTYAKSCDRVESWAPNAMV